MDSIRPALTFTLALLAAAPAWAGQQTITLDADGDGFRWSGFLPGGLRDCDDHDPNTYPGAPELCDGLDNNCSGGIGAFEKDADGDGWLRCEDCDDHDATSHPGATEVCDGADNDCDGVVDLHWTLPDLTSDDGMAALVPNGLAGVVATDEGDGTRLWAFGPGVSGQTVTDGSNPWVGSSGALLLDQSWPATEPVCVSAAFQLRQGTNWAGFRGVTIGLLDSDLVEASLDWENEGGRGDAGLGVSWIGQGLAQTQTPTLGVVAKLDTGFSGTEWEPNLGQAVTVGAVVGGYIDPLMTGWTQGEVPLDDARTWINAKSESNHVVFGWDPTGAVAQSVLMVDMVGVGPRTQREGIASPPVGGASGPQDLRLAITAADNGAASYSVGISELHLVCLPCPDGELAFPVIPEPPTDWTNPTSADLDDDYLVHLKRKKDP